MDTFNKIKPIKICLSFKQINIRIQFKTEESLYLPFNSNPFWNGKSNNANLTSFYNFHFKIQWTIYEKRLIVYLCIFACERRYVFLFFKLKSKCWIGRLEYCDKPAHFRFSFFSNGNHENRCVGVACDFHRKSSFFSAINSNWDY